MTKVYDMLVNDLGMSDRDAKIREYHILNFQIMVKIVGAMSIIFLALGEIKAFLLVNLILIFTRGSFGGVHFRSEIKCFLLSLFTILCIIYGSYLNITTLFKIILYGIVTISWWLYVPKGTSLFPIRREDVRRRKKLMALIIIIASMFLNILLPGRAANIVLLTVVANILLVYPVTYKVFGVKEERDSVTTTENQKT